MLEVEVRKSGTIAPEGLGELEFDPERNLIFDYGPPLEGHANGLVLRAFDTLGNLYHAETYYSVGGGFVMTEAELRRDREGEVVPLRDEKEALNFPYPFGTAKEILAWAPPRARASRK